MAESLNRIVRIKIRGTIAVYNGQDADQTADASKRKLPIEGNQMPIVQDLPPILCTAAEYATRIAGAINYLETGSTS